MPLRCRDLLLIAALAAYAAVLAFSAAAMAPTTDEPGHLVAGLYTWRSGRCSLYYVNPPLTKIIAAAPVMLAGFEEDWRRTTSTPPARPEFNVGEQLVKANGVRFFWLLTLARWAMLTFSLLGAYICWRWGRELFGPASGWAALALWCGCPSILGHGALVTADVPAAAVGVLTGYCGWRWLSAPTLDRALALGLAIGLCWLVKLTWILWPLIGVAIWTFYALTRRLPDGVTYWQGLQQLAAAGLVAWVTLICGYAFEGLGTPLGEFQFTFSSLTGEPLRDRSPRSGNRFAGTWLGDFPVPLPSSFVYGIDAQRQDFEEQHDLYFAAERSRTGWWYFYLAAFGLKEPVGFLALFVLSVAGWRSRVHVHDWVGLSLVWLPAAAVLALVSSQPALNYYRYAIPALPFVFVWTSQVAGWIDGRHRLRSGVILALLAASVASGVASVPHSISYVNELGGGTWQGDRWFIDGNFDWGQDLFALRDWQAAHPEATPLMVAYFGPCRPDLAGIQCIDPPILLLQADERPADYRTPPGWYALSATMVHSRSEWGHSARAGLLSVRDAGLAVFENETPVDRAGPSILIYHIP